jgi:hypothetical protein
MKALKWLFYLIVLAAVVVIGGSVFLPSEAVVTRSTENRGAARQGLRHRRRLSPLPGILALGGA